MRKPFLTRGVRLSLCAAAVLTTASCSDLADAGRSPAFVIVDSIQGASGADPNTFGTFLLSDVETMVEQQVAGQTVRVATIYNDLGRATFRLALKDPGTVANPNAPSTINQITLNRYRVSFRRADGRNTPGVDVPHGFDGAFTITIPSSGTAQAGFEIVRHQMKKEPPLRNLARSGGQNLISTIAEFTFFGRDQAGNEVQATATMTVNFGDFADPQ
ncbi:MAG: hypothetical protein ABR606_01425 [Vicinamibacterales bacterium]